MELFDFFKRTSHASTAPAKNQGLSVKSAQHPRVGDLKALIDQNLKNKSIGKPPEPHEMRALMEKYDAMTREPSTIEKTMSFEQLYNSGSNLWMRDFSASQLSYYFLNEAVIHTAEEALIMLNKVSTSIIVGKPGTGKTQTTIMPTIP